MPKVSPEHVEKRKHQILEAACLCFAEKGFAGTTIQDICRRSGLSTGAVYSYYKGKEDLIRALASANVQQNEQLFSASDDEETLAATLGRLHGVLREAFGQSDRGDGLDANRVKVMLWAESLRDDEMAEGVEDAYEHAVRKLAQLFRKAHDRGEVSAAVPPEAAAQVLLALWEGHSLQKAFDPELDSERYLDAIETVLDAGLVSGLKASRGGPS